jgi:hypothetical protein
VGWCIAMAPAAKVASWSSLIMIFGVMREVREWEQVRAIFYTVMHVNKKEIVNKNMNPFFRRFLVFEMLLFMLYYCIYLFS